jgi:hypothetical protein
MIFILGIQGRSGTNFMLDLLELHPSVEAVSVASEDWVVDQLHHLEQLAATLESRWASPLPDLRRRLGEELARQLARGIDDRVVLTKSPTVHNLELFPRYFPDAHLVLLIRDGRAVVESTVRSFGTSYEGATRRWAEAARTIGRFLERRDHRLHHLVRFEDLIADRESTMRQLIAELGLESDCYDFAARLPGVRGSSELTTSGDLHWRPVDLGPGFDPTRRWVGWSGWRHARFAHLAGEEMLELGYRVEPVKAPMRYKVRNLVLDVAWFISDRPSVIGPTRKVANAFHLRGIV